MSLEPNRLYETTSVANVRVQRLHFGTKVRTSWLNSSLNSAEASDLKFSQPEDDDRTRPQPATGTILPGFCVSSRYADQNTNRPPTTIRVIARIGRST